MEPYEIEATKKARTCAAGQTDGNRCADDCAYDERLKRCVPETLPETQFAAKFMDGSKYLTFRSNKKPAFSFRIPINADTLIGKYSGAIRFCPSTGKLHLCYGPMSKYATGAANRPVLSMLVKPKLSENLWAWYLNSGKTLQKRRITELADDVDVSYTELYASPGASYQLSYVEANYLEHYIEDVNEKIHVNTPLPDGLAHEDVKVETLMDLAKAPDACPPILGNNHDPKNGCLEDKEFGAHSMSDDDDDYRSWDVLGHAPNKTQKRGSSKDYADDADDHKLKKKRDHKPKPQRSPIPSRLRVDRSIPPLTKSLESQREKERERGPNDYVRIHNSHCFFMEGYERTPAFTKFAAVLKKWKAEEQKKRPGEEGTTQLVGTTTATMPLQQGGATPDMFGVNTVVNYLLHSIPMDAHDVCIIANGKIVKSGTALDQVKAMLMIASKMTNDTDTVERLKYTYIAALCLAWLQGLVHTYADPDHVATLMSDVMYNEVINDARLSRSEQPIFSTKSRYRGTPTENSQRDARSAARSAAAAEAAAKAKAKAEAAEAAAEAAAAAAQPAAQPASHRVWTSIKNRLIPEADNVQADPAVDNVGLPEAATLPLVYIPLVYIAPDWQRPHQLEKMVHDALKNFLDALQCGNKLPPKSGITTEDVVTLYRNLYSWCRMIPLDREYRGTKQDEDLSDSNSSDSDSSDSD